jgi:hypothetical protein
MIFTTIEAAPDLSPIDRRRVAGAGPSAVLTRSNYTSLLRSAGFDEVGHSDITPAYRSTQRAWTEAMRSRSSAIGAAMGHQAFEQRLADRVAALAAIDDGLLRRSRYISARV